MLDPPTLVLSPPQLFDPPTLVLSPPLLFEPPVDVFPPPLLFEPPTLVLSPPPDVGLLESAATEVRLLSAGAACAVPTPRPPTAIRAPAASIR